MKRATLTFPNPLNGGDTDLRVAFSIKRVSSWTDNLNQYEGEVFGAPEEIEIHVRKIEEGKGGEFGWWQDITARCNEDDSLPEIVATVKDRWVEREHNRWENGATRLHEALTYFDAA